MARLCPIVKKLAYMTDDENTTCTGFKAAVGVRQAVPICQEEYQLLRTSTCEHEAARRTQADL